MSDLATNLQQLLARVPVKMAAAVRDVAANGLGGAALRAPLGDGDLRASGYVEMGGRLVATSNADGGVQILADPPTPEGDQVRAVIGFSAPHATVQHERLDLQHTTGEAKWLERKLNEMASAVSVDLAKRLDLR